MTVHAAATAVAVALSLLNLPTCSDINAAGIQAAFAGTRLVMQTSSGVDSAIPFTAPWFRSPATSMTCVQQSNATGSDTTGPFESVTYAWGPAGASTADFQTTVRVYTSVSAIGFSQSWPNGATNTASGDPDGLVSAWPGLALEAEGTALGYAHFSGFMAGNYPQYGPWDQSEDSLTLYGGIKDSGMLCLFDKSVKATLVFSPAASFMAASLSVRFTNATNFSSPRVVEWGVMGNATSIPADFEIEWLAYAAASGPTEAVRDVGALLRRRYNRPSEEDSHARDFTLRTIGYGTDNGAYYYYYTGPNKSWTYEDVMRAVKSYSVDARLPYRYTELDSWWYYRADGKDKFGVPLSGVVNWTAMPSIFPTGGLPYLYANITNWRVMAHNRYWATNNVYASNPEIPIGPTDYTGKTFEFAWGKGAGLPLSEEFWNNLFDINNDWGLSVYLQDWLSLTTNSMPQLTQNVTFGREWLMQMGRAAGLHQLSVLYCMSFPRHIFQALEVPSVTQARASNDYQPQTQIFDYDQWRIGESSLFVTALGLAPSKDTYWSMSVPQYAPHYDPIWDARETRNRLESLASSMSNGIVQVSDRVGFTNRTLVIKACDQGGRLLRPATAATPIDRYYAFRAFGPAVRGGVTGVVHSTHSTVVAGGLSHGYLLAAKLTETLTLFPSDLPKPLRDDAASGAIVGWLAYEANTTNVPTFFDATQGAMNIAPNDEYSFEYWTFAPIPKGARVALVGEQSKWIAASAQRFSDTSTTESTMSVELSGDAHEEVTVTFGVFSWYKDGSIASVGIVRATCTVSESLRVFMTVDADNSNNVQCRHG